MATNLYNLNFLIRIKIRDKIECQHIGWKEGFYDFMGTYPYTAEDLKTGQYNDIEFLVEGQQVFYKPFVKLFFSSGINTTKEFNTLAEAEEWAFSIKNKIPNQIWLNE